MNTQLLQKRLAELLARRVAEKLKTYKRVRVQIGTHTQTFRRNQPPPAPPRFPSGPGVIDET
jgi:hypothetical protein